MSFIDDDNWVYPDWVAIVSELMSAHHDIGACGGLNEPVADSDLPWWFDQYQVSYAVGPQDVQAGDITSRKGVLCGAGLTVRKSAWQSLVKNGFQARLVGRKGKSLLCSEDYELCLALRLAGWWIWYEPRMRLRHYLPVHRLTWRHLKSMVRGWGASTVYLDPYFMAIDPNQKILENRFVSSWKTEVLAVLASFIRQWEDLFEVFFE